MKTVITTIAAAVVLVALLAAAAIWTGAYNVAADDPHWAPVHAVIEATRKRSIESRAARLSPPDMVDPARIRQGAGNYDAMCTGCHLAPGMDDTEMSRGLYPPPPNLSVTTVDAAEAFWVIKHGIKASGMPAWGGSMDDEYIWNMAAFLQALPGMDAADYKAMVASSGGHDHGGGETGSHHQENSEPMVLPAPAGAENPHGGPATGEAPRQVEHTHADGTVETHPVPPASSAPTDDHDDAHDHHH